MNVSSHEGALVVDLRRVAIGNRTDDRRRPHEIDPPTPALRERQLEVVRVVEQVCHQLPVARSSETRHPVAHIGEEALTRLLAVVADVDARTELSGDARPGCVLDGGLHLDGVHELAPAALAV